jgi:halocyanin-like protein
MQAPSTRRRFLQTAGLLGLTGAAGCLSTDQSDSPSTETSTDSPSDSGTPTDRQNTTNEPPSLSDDLSTWLSNANNFDGGAVEKTNTDTVTIQVGVKDGERYLAFDPPVVAISTGTTVQWHWTGNGGAHDVVFVDADVPSSQIHTDSGVYLEYTFERRGSYRYVCKPHEDLGQKGAIIVVEY